MKSMEMFRFVLGSAFLLIGMVVFAIEVFGIFRLPCALNRLHSAALGDTLGISSCMIGLMIMEGFTFTTLKMALVILFFWMASPVSSHLLANLEITTYADLDSKATTYEDISLLEDEMKQNGAKREN